MKKLVSEFIGTYFLVFFGTGAVVVNHLQNDVFGHLGIALSFGVIVTVLIFLLADDSGAHFNPAVSVVFFLRKDLSLVELVGFISVQCIGAILASTTLLLLFPSTTTLGMTIPSGSVLQSFVLEFILTFFLIFSILKMINQGKSNWKNQIAYVVGLVVFIEALVAGPICGASMNPARSIGPAVVSFNFEFLWVYILAPIVGGLFAYLIDFFLKKEN